MIVEFFARGTGRGSGPVEYVTRAEDPLTGKAREPNPTVLKGDPEQTIGLIDGLSFKHKYTSGALSFEPGQWITPEMERDIMQSFEKTAFAGLREEQYDILWVRHEHAGKHEMHFVTPKVELESGKQLNIRPPGKSHQDLFDSYRDTINYKYRLADPEDPERARELKIPDFELKKEALGKRVGELHKDDARIVLDAFAQTEVRAGRVKSQEDMKKAFTREGFEVPRAGREYITVKIDDLKLRLKGPMYGRDFDGKLEKRELTAKEKRNLLENRIGKSVERLQALKRHRAEDHKKRYKPKKELRQEQQKERSRAGEKPKELSKKHRTQNKPEKILPEGIKNDGTRKNNARNVKGLRERLSRARAATTKAFERASEAARRLTEVRISLNRSLQRGSKIITEKYQKLISKIKERKRGKEKDFGIEF